MSDPAPHRYVREGLEQGHDEDVVRRAATQIARTSGRDAQPILSLRHLAHLAGAPYLYLRQIVQRAVDPYTNIVRPKRNGGMRLISAPEPVMMDVQRVILRRALHRMPLHPASFAYQQGRSIVDCARQHQGARWMIKFDLHNFFDSISERRAYTVFESRGYSPLVAFELARLCTRAPVAHGWARRVRHYPVIPAYEVQVRGRLPQGAPTSGALANAVATPLDEAMAQMVAAEGFEYTRYSDDIVMSTSRTFDRPLAKTLIGAVGETVASHGFSLHRKKTRVIPPGARHVVLGLLLHDDGVRLTPEFRRKIEVHVRGVEKFGLIEHSNHRGFRSLLSFVSYVDGCLAFAASVEPVWAEHCRTEWTNALRSRGFPV